MKKYFVCDICGKKSKICRKILQCEADHLGIELCDYLQYRNMKTRVKHAKWALYNAKNSNDAMRIMEAEGELKEALKDSKAFEEEHNIDGSIITDIQSRF